MTPDSPKQTKMTSYLYKQGKDEGQSLPCLFVGTTAPYRSLPSLYWWLSQSKSAAVVVESSHEVARHRGRALPAVLSARAHSPCSPPSSSPWRSRGLFDLDIVGVSSMTSGGWSRCGILRLDGRVLTMRLWLSGSFSCCVLCRAQTLIVPEVHRERGERFWTHSCGVGAGE
jgi:hypothetical protein